MRILLKSCLPYVCICDARTGLEEKYVLPRLVGGWFPEVACSLYFYCCLESNCQVFIDNKCLSSKLCTTTGDFLATRPIRRFPSSGWKTHIFPE